MPDLTMTDASARAGHAAESGRDIDAAESGWGVDAAESGWGVDAADSGWSVDAADSGWGAHVAVCDWGVDRTAGGGRGHPQPFTAHHTARLRAFFFSGNVA